MSQAHHLTKEKIERVKFFLRNNSIEGCCEKFNVGSPAFREGIINTVKSLHGFYIRGDEHYLGRFMSTKDISLNKDLILSWIERHKRKEKPNAFYSQAVEPDEEEITRAILDTYPNEPESKLLIEGALWVLRNYKVTGK